MEFVQPPLIIAPPTSEAQATRSPSETTKPAVAAAVQAESAAAKEVGDAVPKKKKKMRYPKPIMNIHYTQYPIVKTMAKECGFRCRTDDLNLMALAGHDGQPNSQP